MSGQDKLVAELIRGLKHERDELKLQMHLATMEIRDKLDKIGDRLDALDQQYQPLKKVVADSTDDVWESVKLVGYEISDGLKRIREAL